MSEVKDPSENVAWYRVPVPREELARLNRRSDLKGMAQTLLHLGLIACTGATAVYSAAHWPWWATLLAVFVHGTLFAFTLNAFHELCHGTVFRTRFLNELFLRIYSFLGWFDYVGFQESHQRHHKYTLHPPADLEVVLPIRMTLKGFLRSNFINLRGPYWTVKGLLRTARGTFEGDWTLRLFPATGPSRRAESIRWARTMLIGHGLILIASLALRLWMVPVVLTFAAFYGTWLRFLCNETQHVGLRDSVPDFRLCCRTIRLNPFLSFMYWQMNYHIEHHMYAAIPCYNLPKLHAVMKDQLPPTPDGLVETWRQIAAILKRQKEDPSYQFTAPLPD